MRGTCGASGTGVGVRKHPAYSATLLFGPVGMARRSLALRDRPGETCEPRHIGIGATAAVVAPVDPSHGLLDHRTRPRAVLEGDPIVELCLGMRQQAVAAGVAVVEAAERLGRFASRRRPEDVKQSQHRIARTNQRSIRMATKHGTQHGASGGGAGAERRVRHGPK